LKELNQILHKQSLLEIDELISIWTSWGPYIECTDVIL